MGIPGVNMIFQSKGAEAIREMQRGIIAMVVVDETVEAGVYELDTVADAPSELSVENKALVANVMAGGVTKCIISVGNAEAETNDLLGALEPYEFDWFTMVVDGASRPKAVAWVKGLRADARPVKAVLGNATGADSEAIVNFTTGNVKTKDKTYTAEEYAPIMAGKLAGLSLTTSSTFMKLTDVIDVPKVKKSEINNKVAAGEMVLEHNGRFVRVARGINSLTTTSAEKNAQYKKIKVVEIMDKIQKDLTRTIEDEYIGKVSNSYDNKRLLISAINGYFDTIVRGGLVDKGARAEIDLQAQLNYIKTNGQYVSGMTEQQIKEANTDDKVFLLCHVKPLDAMEEITITVIM